MCYQDLKSGQGVIEYPLMFLTDINHKTFEINLLNKKKSNFFPSLLLNEPKKDIEFR